MIRLYDCPSCGSNRTGVVQHHTGDDLADMRRAARSRYYIYFIPRDQPLIENRFCMDCHFMWKNEDFQPEDNTHLSHSAYLQTRPAIDYKKHRFPKLKKTIQKWMKRYHE